MEIYAHPASQPSRSVLWFCAINQIECTVITDPSVDLSNINSRQQIPFLKHENFTLSEMPAILMYLAELHELHTWWPRDIQARAKVQSYLHSHHTLTRLATLTLMAPNVLTVFEEPPFGPNTSYLSNKTIQAALADPNKLSNGQALMRDIMHVFENHYLADASSYINGMNVPSIADLAAYEEIAQLSWSNLFDLSDFPNTQHWLDLMSRLPKHDDLHRFNSDLGDIVQAPIDMPRFFQAISAGLEGLQQAGLRLRV